MRALPGVGPYTARAVRAFAFGDDVAAVDTNGVRVLARAVAGAPLTVPEATGTRATDWCRPASRGSSTRRCSTWAPPSARRHDRTAAGARCGASAPGGAAGRPLERRPVAVEPDGAAPEHLRRIRPPGQGTPARCPAPGRRAPERPGRRLRLARGRAAGRAHRAAAGGRGLRRSGPAERTRSSGCASGVRARRAARAMGDQLVKKLMMRRLTTSGRSTCRKWPASSMTSTSEPSAMKSSGEPMDESSMQPSSRPCR